MAYQDNLNELFDIPELQRQQEAAVKFVKEYLQEVTDASQKIKGLDLSISSASSLKEVRTLMKDVEKMAQDNAKTTLLLAKAKEANEKAALAEAKALNELSKAYTNEAKAANENSKATLNDAKARNENTKAAANEAKELKELSAAYLNEAKEKKESAAATLLATRNRILLSKESEKEAAALRKANNEYEVAKKKYKELSDEAKRLYFALGADSEQFQRVSAEANKLHIQLSAAEQSVGQFQRQVGNYNIVGIQFQQLLGELPNLALSFRTWVISMSNNIAGFAQNLLQAVKETGSWRNALGLLFTKANIVLTVINLAVTALTYFASQTGKAEKSTKGLADETDNLTEALKRNIKAERELMELRRDKNNIGSEAELKRQIDLMKAQGKSELEIFMAQQQYHSKRIENLRDEANTYKRITDATDQYFEHYKRTFPTYSKDAIGKLVTAALTGAIKENTRVTEEEAAKQAKAIVDSYGKAGGAYEELTSSRIQLLSAAKDAENELNVNSLDFQRKINEDIAKDDKELSGKQLKDYEKYLKERKEKEKQLQSEFGAGELKTQTQIMFDSATEDFKNYANEVEIGSAALMQKVEQQYKNGAISAEEYEKARVEAANTAALKKLQIELDYYKKVSDLIYDPAKRDEVLKKISEIEVEMLKITNDEKLDKYKEDAKNKKEADDEKLKNEKAYQQKSKELEEEKHRRIKELRLQLVDTVAQVGAFINEKEQRELDDRSKLLEQEKTVELAKIEALAIADEEKAAKKATLEQDTLQKQKEIEQQKENLEKRRFQMEQAAALARLFINTQETVAKIQAEAAVLKAGVATAPLAAVALSQIPYVYASAALSAGLIAGQIVAYAEGVENKPFDGPALVGEGMQGGMFVPEIVKPKGGKPFITSGPMIMQNLPKGSDVIPMPEILAMPEVITPQLLNSMMLQSGGNTEVMEGLLHQAIGVLKQIKNKETSQTTIKNGSMYMSRKRGHEVDIYLRKNYYN